MNKAIIWILVAVVVVVGIVLLSGGKSTPPGDITAPTGDTTGTESGEAMIKPATSNIDDAVASILSEAAADGQAPTEADPSLTAEENLSGLDQTLDTSNVE